MSELDMNAVRKWGFEHYPSVMHNEALLIKLYKKHVLNESSVVKQKNVVVAPYRKIATLKKFERALLRVVKVEITKDTSYFGCAVCKKKNCVNEQHVKDGTKEYFMLGADVGDSTGEIEILFFEDDASNLDEIKNNDLFLLMGAFKNDRNGNEIFSVYEYKVLTQEEDEALGMLEEHLMLHGGDTVGEDESKFKAFLFNLKDYQYLFDKIQFTRAEGRVRW